MSETDPDEPTIADLQRRQTNPHPTAAMNAHLDQDAPKWVRQPWLPGCEPVPPLGEAIFASLVDRWGQFVRDTPKGHPPPREADEINLACLLVMIEWSQHCTFLTARPLKKVHAVLEAQDLLEWYNQLPWELCAEAERDSSAESVLTLTGNLDHHNSSIRIWMMEIAWFALPWLNPVEARRRLLKNVADTLGGVTLAAALAGRFYPDEEAFLKAAQHYTPPTPFGEQYKERLTSIEKQGIQSLQSPLWKLECACRKHITQAAIALGR